MTGEGACELMFYRRALLSASPLGPGRTDSRRPGPGVRERSLPQAGARGSAPAPTAPGSGSASPTHTRPRPAWAPLTDGHWEVRDGRVQLGAAPTPRFTHRHRHPAPTDSDSDSDSNRSAASRFTTTTMSVCARVRRQPVPPICAHRSALFRLQANPRPALRWLWPIAGMLTSRTRGATVTSRARPMIDGSKRRGPVRQRNYHPINGRIARGRVRKENQKWRSRVSPTHQLAIWIGENGKQPALTGGIVHLQESVLSAVKCPQESVLSAVRRKVPKYHCGNKTSCVDSGYDAGKTMSCVV